jgi:ribosomal protein S25
MTEPDVVMAEPRQREVEGLARTMLLQSVSITPHRLAVRAEINWFAARDVLRGLARKGHATTLPRGRFRSTLAVNHPSEWEIGVTVTQGHVGLPRPQSGEEVSDAQTMAGMRRAILRGARSSSLIRQCLKVAQSRLLSREEIYVFLAYEALLRLEELHQAHEYLKDARLVPLTGATTDGHL